MIWQFTMRERERERVGKRWQSSVIVAFFALFAFLLFCINLDFANADETASVETDSTECQVMYRLYNKWTGEHFYTASSDEKSNLEKAGWTHEGVGWYAPTSSNTPVYRLYNKHTAGGDHHYTMDKSEYDKLVKLGWSGEGVGWYSDDNKEVPVLRQYNPNEFANNHNFTTSSDENDNLVKAGWKAEGVAWYGVASSTYSTKQAFAVYSADDQSINFYKRTTVPTQGSKFEGKTATQVFTGIENMPGFTSNKGKVEGIPGWSDLYETVKTVTIVDEGIQPVNMDFWFGVSSSTRNSSGVNILSELKQVNGLSKIDTSQTTSMFGVFHSAERLEAIDVSSWNTSKVENMSSMFGDCATVTELDLSNFNTSKVKDMSGMFSASRNLKAIKGTDSWDVSNVESMEYMFEQCLLLEDLDLSRWNVSNVTNMGGMFSYCPTLKTLDVSNWDTSNVADMSSMFGFCENLTELDLSKWNTSNVEDMQRMFYFCKKLTTDCSMWNVSKVTSHTNFNGEAPGVTAPVWKN